MNNENELTFSTWTQKGKKILDKSNEIFLNLGISTENLPKNIFDRNRPISLVFAGQYSAGKSTILKALTGLESIETGSAITTQNSHQYTWNGITVIDTPGIGTKLRPDHDEISYKAIHEADILVYVVTHNLFDSFIGKDFRNLVIDEDKASETILLVNKMADVGNTLDIQNIKLEGLRNVTSPYTPEELRTCFIDAESYIDSVNEIDEELANELRNRSNYDNLINTINQFINEKAFPSMLTTALYKLYDLLQNTITEYQPSSGDDDIDALEQMLIQKKHILSKNQWRMKQEVKSIYRIAASDIREIGRSLANSLETFKDEDEAKNEIEKRSNEVDKITKVCTEEVEKCIEEISSECIEQLTSFYDSSFIKNIQISLEKKEIHNNPVLKKIVDSNIIQKTSNSIINNSGGTLVKLKGLSGYKGTQVHQAVLDVGHFFGHSFKPWEAVKITKGINVAGKVIGAVGIVLTIGLQMKDDYDMEKKEQILRTNREEIRGSFNSVADEVEKHFSVALQNLLRECFEEPIDNLSNQIEEIRVLRKGKSESCKLLEGIQYECKQLISEIHRNTFSID